MIQQTSKDAYRSIVPELNQRQRIIYEALLRLGEANDRQITEYCRIPINQVTPRRGELVKLGKIVKIAKRIDTVTKRPAIIWKVKVGIENQLDLF